MSVSITVMTLNLHRDNPNDSPNTWEARRDVCISVVTKYNPVILCSQQVFGDLDGFICDDGPWTLCNILLPLTLRSLLVMQGNSVDISRHAICSSPRKRTTITFVKIQPRKARNFPNLLSGILRPPSLSMTHHPLGQQSSAYTQVHPHSHRRATSPVVSLIPQHVFAPGIEPLFAGLAGHAGAYPSITVLDPGWSMVPSLTRMPSPGTGVFLPSSGSASSPDSIASAKAVGKDIINGRPKLYSNGSGISKHDQVKRSSSRSKTNGNKANSIIAGGTDG